MNKREAIKHLWSKALLLRTLHPPLTGPSRKFLRSALQVVQPGSDLPDGRRPLQWVRWSWSALLAILMAGGVQQDCSKGKVWVDFVWAGISAHWCGPVVLTRCACLYKNMASGLRPPLACSNGPVWAGFMCSNKVSYNYLSFLKISTSCHSCGIKLFLWFLRSLRSCSFQTSEESILRWTNWITSFKKISFKSDNPFLFS